jgi:enoyl-CoA hydratase/carnithine racemase
LHRKRLGPALAHGFDGQAREPQGLPVTTENTHRKKYFAYLSQSFPFWPIVNQMLYSGEFISFIHAKDVGLVDEICRTEEIENLAVEKISTIANHPNQAFSAIKASKVELIKIRYEKNWEATNRVFLDCWFSEPGQTLLKEASRKF